VLGGVAAVVQQKLRRSGQAQQDKDSLLIRSYDNGWVFAIDSITYASSEIEEQVKQQAIAAVKALGLDFGAVDVIVNKKGTKAYVLEVNTAPGIESPTVLAAYVAYIRGVNRG
jgi:D-alanine-D-alanine ligase-like ATP-grasp enzyme